MTQPTPTPNAALNALYLACRTCADHIETQGAAPTLKMLEGLAAAVHTVTWHEPTRSALFPASTQAPREDYPVGSIGHEVLAAVDASPGIRQVRVGYIHPGNVEGALANMVNIDLLRLDDFGYHLTGSGKAMLTRLNSLPRPQ